MSQGINPEPSDEVRRKKKKVGGGAEKRKCGGLFPNKCSSAWAAKA